MRASRSFLLFDKMPDFTGISSEHTQIVTVENIKDKLSEANIEYKQVYLGDVLKNKLPIDLQKINSLMTELHLQKILNLNSFKIVLQHYDALRYLIDAFYHADHTYHYLSQFNESKSTHVKLNYWRREKKFILKLFQYQYLLPTLADYLHYSFSFNPEIILYSEKFDRLMNIAVYNIYKSKQECTEPPTEEDFIVKKPGV